jgi:hypothetical protein
MNDELIITVIATGFDSAYFRQKAGQLADTSAPGHVASSDDEDGKPASDVQDEDMNKLDMDLDKKDEASEDFSKDEEPKNIWHYDDEADAPAFMRRRKKEEDK